MISFAALDGGLLANPGLICSNMLWFDQANDPSAAPFCPPFRFTLFLRRAHSRAAAVIAGVSGASCWPCSATARAIFTPIQTPFESRPMIMNDSVRPKVQHGLRSKQ